jgi:hypothetical protein
MEDKQVGYAIVQGSTHSVVAFTLGSQKRADGMVKRLGEFNFKALPVYIKVEAKVATDAEAVL